MDKREVKIDYTVYENSCPSAYEAICRKAVEVIPNAYSIYSGFSVGAAVLLENGEIVAGTNQEMQLIRAVFVRNVQLCFMHSRFIRE